MTTPQSKKNKKIWILLLISVILCVFAVSLIVGNMNKNKTDKNKSGISSSSPVSTAVSSAKSEVKSEQSISDTVLENEMPNTAGPAVNFGAPTPSRK